MIEQIPAEVLKAFTTYTQASPQNAAGKITVERIGNGLINHSYKVNYEPNRDIFLQRINKNVFPDPYAVQENYITLWEFAEFEFTGLKMPYPIRFPERDILFRDYEGNLWRAFEFIGEGITLSIPGTSSRAGEIAKAFARFTEAFEEFNTDRLKEVIPGFHDLGQRYMQFEDSLRTGIPERLSATAALTNELKNRERYRHFYDIITASGEFPRRVMHHDAKIGNILFHHKTGEVICAVDYDTVMPGYFFSDLGDMVRSMAGNLDENSRGQDIVKIHKDSYDAILTGYSAVLGNQLTASEKKYLHSAGLIMIYMQTLRFLTDFHNGDTYYQTRYKGQNLDRAKNQFSLLKALEEFLHKNYALSI